MFTGKKWQNLKENSFNYYIYAGLHVSIAHFLVVYRERDNICSAVTNVYVWEKTEKSFTFVWIWS